MTQEIIVYSNPAEKAMWDMFSNTSVVAWLVPIVGAAIVYGIVWAVVHMLYAKVVPIPSYVASFELRRKRLKVQRLLATWIAAISAAIVFFMLVKPLI